MPAVTDSTAAAAVAITAAAIAIADSIHVRQWTSGLGHPLLAQLTSVPRHGED
jgi:hypothetical protein